MLMLRGPTKVDVIFPDESQAWTSAWEPTPETLELIDAHFWDWILWLEQKRRRGDEKLLEKSLGDMHELMLEPMGVATRPNSVAEAVRVFLDARDRLESRFRVEVPRDLELEVRPVLG